MIFFFYYAARVGFRYPIHESVDLLNMGRDRGFDNAIPIIIFPIAVRAIVVAAYRVPICLVCLLFCCIAVIPSTIIIAINQGFPATVACNAV